MLFKYTKSNKIYVALITLVVMVGFIALLTTYSFKVRNTPPEFSDRYLDLSLSIDERVKNLISQMTLKEKIGQMALVEKNSILKPGDISEYGLGGVLSGAGAKPEVNTREGWFTMVSDITDESLRSRLAIPVLFGVDAIHGHGNVPGATIFPHFIGLGATRDVELVEKVARATAEELRITGIRWSYSPTLDVVEDIRWGRTYETFSSDPKLVGLLGGAYVRGLQNKTINNNNNNDALSVLATVKHYIGVGGMQWNSSSNPNFRIDQGNTRADETKLREIYLPPFKSAVDDGALSVMAALNSWGGKKLSAEKYLLTDILKGELDFKGFVVSDWYGVYEMPGPDFYNAVIAINAGIDMIMLPFDYKTFVNNVSWAVMMGLISESRIDDAVNRILYTKFKLGLFDDIKSNPTIDTFGSVSHRVLAREAVAKSVVLLKNENSLLPISPDVRRINVAGAAGDNIGRQVGAWTVEWQGIDGNWLDGATSILEGINEEKDNGVSVVFSPDGLFSETEAIADIGIAVVGEAPYAEGWGDSENLTLSEGDLLVIDNLRKNSKKVVVVLVTGRPLFIADEITKWDALTVVWLPGSEGAGVADVLFGKKPFTGQLPLSWPRNIQQLPITADEKTNDGSPVLFQRYFGLRN